MKLYLFGKFGVWSYNQSENDWTSKEIKSHFAKCGEKEQIVVWRLDNLLYYTYYYKFAKNKYCGICVMSDCVLCDFDILFDIFYNSLLEIAKRNVVLFVDKEGNFQPKSKKITDDAMSIDDCFKFLRQSIEQISTEKLTTFNMGRLHSNAVACCNLLVDSNRRITEAILDSYSVVVVIKGDANKLLSKAKECLKNGEYQDALRFAEKSLEYGGDNVEANDVICNVSAIQREKANPLIEKAKESCDNNDFIQAIHFINDVLAITVSDEEVDALVKNIEKGITHNLENYIKLGQFDDAVKICDEIIDKDDNLKDKWGKIKTDIENRKKKYECLVADADRHLSDKDFEKSKTQYYKALSISSNKDIQSKIKFVEREEDKAECRNKKRIVLKKIRAEVEVLVNKNNIAKARNRLDEFKKTIQEYSLYAEYKEDIESLYLIIEPKKNIEPKKLENNHIKQNIIKEKQIEPNEQVSVNPYELFQKGDFSKARKIFITLNNVEMVKLCTKFIALSKQIDTIEKRMSESGDKSVLLKELNRIKKQYKERKVDTVFIDELLTKKQLLI